MNPVELPASWLRPGDHVVLYGKPCVVRSVAIMHGAPVQIVAKPDDIHAPALDISLPPNTMVQPAPGSVTPPRRP